MKFNTPFEHEKFTGEINSGELVTEPGQSFTTREIYTRYLVTGRVEGMGRRVSYDSDELKNEPGFDDNVTPKDAAVDPLTAYSEARDNLEREESKRKDIQNHIARYQSGQISFDELCEYLRMKAPNNAPGLIKYFGQQLGKTDKEKPNETT